MKRDQGPTFNLGFGIRSQDLPEYQNEHNSPNPESGIVAKALYAHPVAKWLAVHAGTMVGMLAAEKIMHGKGIHILDKLGGQEYKYLSGATQNRLIHSFRSVQKTLDEFEGRGRVVSDILRPSTDEEFTTLGWDRAHEALKEGTEGAPEWLLRDELQRRIIRQARRAPTELVAAYFSQKFIVDPITGDNRDQRPVKWYNPVDVISDFADTSLHNVTSLMLPTAVGGALGKTVWRNLLAGGEVTVPKSRAQQYNKNVSVSLHRTLELFGQDASKLLDKTSSLSQRSAGALSSGLNAAIDARQPLSLYLHNIRQSAKTKNLKDLARNTAKAAWAFPGQSITKTTVPFKQFWRAGKASWDEYTPTGQIVSHGDSPIERFASSLRIMGGSEGEFATRRRQEEYADRLRHALIERGITAEDAVRFVNEVTIKIPSNRFSPVHDFADLESRLVFGDQPLLGSSAEARTAELIRRGRISIDPKDFIAAIRKADTDYRFDFYRIQDKIASQWDRVYQDSVIPMIHDYFDNLKHVKLPHTMFNEWDENNYGIALRRLSKHFGVENQDVEATAAKIRAQGLNPEDLGTIRALLRENGEITGPQYTEGFNLLGYKPLSVQEALGRNYFKPELRAKIEEILSALGRHEGSGVLLTPVAPHAYISENGRIVNVTEQKIKLRRMLDKFANEFQIPFIKMRPLRLMQFGANKDKEALPMVQYISSYAQGKFVDSAHQGYIAVRHHGTRSRLVGFSSQPLPTDTGFSTTLSTIPGQYIVQGTDPYSTNRFLRLAIGDEGRIPNEEPSRLKRLFHVDSDQPYSIFGLINRFRNRKNDLTNPLRFAEELTKREGAFQGFSTQDIATGMRAFSRYIGSYGLNDESISSMPEPLRAVFSVNGQHIPNVKNKEDLVDLIRDELKDDLREASPEQKRELGRLQRRLKTHLAHYDRSPGDYLAGPASLSQQRAGLFDKADILKADLYRYQIDRNGLFNNEDARLSILNHIGHYEDRGIYPGERAKRLRAAILDTYVNDSYRQAFLSSKSEQDRLYHAAANLRGSGQNVQDLLSDIASYKLQGSHNRWPGIFNSIYGKHFSVAPHEFEGVTFNPFGANNPTVGVPTATTAYRRSRLRTVLNAIGITSWKDPMHYSGLSAIPTTLVERLNRYFGLFGSQLNKTQSGGPLPLFVNGMVARRVLPIVGGATAYMTADRTLGGWLNAPLANGSPNYSPLVFGHAAKAVAGLRIAGAYLIGGKKRADEKRDQIYNGMVPIRRGRYWMLSNGPWRGGRIEYYRPNWFRRLTTGYQYTPQTYGSPIERFLYDYDFSPLRPFSPYHFEQQHYYDRPYPVTGEYFTGPWGPLTGVLNATVGRLLKPKHLMHEQELVYGLNQYNGIGEFGAFLPPNAAIIPAGRVREAHKKVRIGRFLHHGGHSSPPMYTAQNDEYESAAYDPAGTPITGHRHFLHKANTRYVLAAKAPGASSGSAQARVVANILPIQAGSLRYNLGELGYQSQEMAGIYGFMVDSTKQAIGLGHTNFGTDRPVLQSAGRAYGSERSFWDLNLGGLGDLPLPIEGEFGNIEISEIIRRFIPHRRRDEDEINPIPNTLGAEYPWLPGPEYMNGGYITGDPFVKIPFGEARLPGPGYEAFHKLHPDKYGRYGIVDIHRILGDIAPYSDQYKTVNRLINSAPLTPEEQTIVRQTRDHVKHMKERHDWHPYIYANQRFNRVPVTITGSVQGHPGEYYTKEFSHPIRLAGVRFKGNPRLPKPGKYEVEYDTNKDPLWNANNPGTIDVVLYKGNENINRDLLQNKVGVPSDTHNPIDYHAQTTHLHQLVMAELEKRAHANTFFNEKFLPYRTPVEEWERQNVYGATFPQWNHPIQGSLAPVFYRSAGRNPFLSAAITGFVFSLFGHSPRSKAIGGLLGAASGFAFSTFEAIRTTWTHQRFIPKRRKQEMAVEENADILNYLRYQRLYNQERLLAMRFEHIDPEKVYERGVGTDLGPLTKQALAYREGIAHTMYGANPFCLSEDTEVLTHRGWMLYSNLREDDQILSLDIENENIVWSDLLGVNVFDWDGELLHWEHPYLDVLMTPEHKWIVRKNIYKNTDRYLRLRKASELAPTNELYLGGGNPTTFLTNPIYSDEFVELVGWYFAEGCNIKDYAIKITQNEDQPYTPRIKEICQYFRDKGALVSEYKYDYKDTIDYYFNRPVSDAIRSVTGPTKALLPEFLNSITHEQALLLYETIINGDGHRHTNYPDSDYLTQKDPDRIDSFQMLCALLGLRTIVYHHGGETNRVGIKQRFGLYLSQRNHGGALKPKSYKGKVWCPTTEQGTWLARRNGQVFWTGNSNPRDLIQAVPKRKRDYFAAALEAPVSDRRRILSTAPRLERRLLEAQWGMKVEKKPDLEGYFQEHELPPPDWEGYTPDADTQAIQIKIAQSQGLDVSQMGYYPQQVRQANLLNPSYPSFQAPKHQRSVLARLREVLGRSGGNYQIRPVNTPYSGSQISYYAGVN